MAELERPIIIVGTGRCGSTMLHRLLARHPDIGWLSTFNEVLPTWAPLSAFSNLYRNDHLSTRLKHRYFFPKPFEAYRFWDRFLPGFSRRDRPLTADDVPDAAIAPLHRKLERILAYQRKRRLLVKVTGWSRIAYFDHVFPDARFVFLNREPRSIISSWIQAGWLDVTSGLDSARWQWGAVPERYRAAWAELGGGPILSAAVKVQLDLDDIRSNLARLPQRCHELQYEDLIRTPLKKLEEVTDFAGLHWHREYEQYLSSRAFHDTRNKWRRYLSDEQGELILRFFDRVGSIVPAGPEYVTA